MTRLLHAPASVRCMEPVRSNPSAAGRAERAAAAAQPAATTRTMALARAGRLLSRAEVLTPAEWRDILQRARTLDVAAYGRALQRLSHVLADDAQPSVLEALNHGACAAANGAASAAGLTDDRATDTCTYAVRVAAHAVLALALAVDLPPEDVDLLTRPFGDAPSSTGVRRAVERAVERAD